MTHVYIALSRRCGLYCCVVYIHQKSFKRS